MEWISWVADPNVWASLVTLTFLEIVLGIDNVIFISILAGKLPRAQQARARALGLGLALVTRILLLVSIKWLMGLTSPLFVLFSHEFSGKDLILLSGGIFLIAKSTQEIHAKLEGEQRRPYAKLRGGFAQTIIQILLLDYIYFAMVFATAVEMLNLRLRSKQRQ
jgi:predicted tellurium resistance membrane protein TerC